MKLHLRDYQKKALDAVVDDLRRYPSTLLVMATGLGKTVVFSHLAKMATKKVLIIAHREELIRQAANKVSVVTGQMPDIDMGLERPHYSMNLFGGEEIASKVTVATVQTLTASNDARLKRYDPDEYSLVIPDEAHHAPAETYLRIFRHFSKNPKCKIVGVTATPDRADEKALGQIFKHVAFVYEIVDGINDGWLVPLEQRLVHVHGVDFSKCRTRAGDLDPLDVARALEFERPLHEFADPVYEIAAGRKTLLFAATVDHSQRIADIFNRHKPNCARHLDGKTDDVTRRRMLKQFHEGEFQFLCNCAVLTEGYDEDTIEVIANCRPTKSRSLYCQIVGRGERTLDGILAGITSRVGRIAAIAASKKPKLTVIDLTGVSGQHKLQTTADILGGDYPEEVIEHAKEMVQNETVPLNMREWVEKSEEELHRLQVEKDARLERDALTRLGLVGKVTFSTEIVDAFDALDVRPVALRGWDNGRPATPSQIETLRRFGVKDAGTLSASHAGQLCQKLIARRYKDRCTLGQAKILKRYNYPTGMSFEDARGVIDKLAANNWRRPAESEV